MRFPTRLLGANMWFALLLYGGFLAVVTLITAGIAIFGSITQSVWEQAAQVPRWYGLVFGVTLVREFLPMYVAHGRTRRRFGTDAAITTSLFAPFLAVLIMAGYLLETGVYTLAGWSQVLDRPHLFTAPAQVPLILTEYTIEALTWIAVGAFVGAGFYRWHVGGVVTLPFAVGLLVLVEGAVGSTLRLPFVWDRLGVALPQSLAVTFGVGLGTYLLGLALSWAIVRDVPLRNRLS